MASRPPSVDALASSLDDGTLPRPLMVEIARRAVATADTEDAYERARQEADRMVALRPRRVINATGVLLHTNLGRARLATEAAAAATDAATEASPIEFDLTTGARGGRGEYVRALLISLTGADSALVVNNTAGALLLALAALAGSRGAIISRGELIEIGGSFRLPELMAATGAQIVEVGTTNRTRLADYASAIDTQTAVLLKVHPSNYRITGFAEEVGYQALGGLAADNDLRFVADIGSGLLDSRVPWLDGPPPDWLAQEPAARQTLAAGASVVMFSGDKLLGGPQAGIIVGDADAMETMRRHPIARAVRIDGASLAALAVTLEMYAGGRGSEIPFWAMATLGAEPLRARSSAVLDAAGVDGEVVEDRSLPGAGTVPGKGIPGPVILMPGHTDKIWRRLLDCDTPVVARRDDRGLILDLRSVSESDDDRVAAALAESCR